MKLKIPEYAKRKARTALKKRRKLPKSQKFGLSVTDSRAKGIRSGVSQAKKLIDKGSLSYSQARPYAAFYQRFKNCRTEKCNDIIDLWGGRKFGQFVTKFVNISRKLKKFK